MSKLKALEMKTNGKKAEIYISGDVISDLGGEYMKDWAIEHGYITPVDVRNALASVDDDTDIDLHINSNGGEVAAGLAIGNFLAQSKHKITCYIDGWAASIATVIALSCGSVKMPKNTYMMIHYPSSTICGNLSELKKAVEDMEKITGSMITFYVDKSNVDTKKMMELLEAETWLTADESAELFDNVEVIDNADLKAVARIEPDLTRNMPSELIDYLTDRNNAKKDMQDTIDKINKAVLDSVFDV